MKDPEVYELGKLCKSDQAKQAQPTAATDAGRDDDKENHQAKIGSKEKTTVMLRNLPNNYTREMFLQMLDENGLKGQYDFVYLPCDFYHDANLGYAFVNMVDASAVFLAWKAFQGFSDWSLPSAKVCQVVWRGPHQGFEAHVERYRNSPLMHQNVPDVFKPMIFRNGKRQPFPKPTKCLQAPFPFWDETNLTQKVQVFVRQCMIPQTDITKPLISMCIEHGVHSVFSCIDVIHVFVQPRKMWAIFHRDFDFDWPWNDPFLCHEVSQSAQKMKPLWTFPDGGFHHERLHFCQTRPRKVEGLMPDSSMKPRRGQSGPMGPMGPMGPCWIIGWQVPL